MSHVGRKLDFFCKISYLSRTFFQKNNHGEVPKWFSRLRRDPPLAERGRFAMPITYILFSQKTKKFYTGSSHENSVDDRLKRHNNGLVQSTKHGRPWKVILVEVFDTYREARKRELFYKSGVGRKQVKEFFQRQSWRGTQVVQGDGLLNR